MLHIEIDTSHGIEYASLAKVTIYSARGVVVDVGVVSLSETKCWVWERQESESELRAIWSSSLKEEHTTSKLKLLM